MPGGGGTGDGGEPARHEINVRLPSRFPIAASFLATSPGELTLLQGARRRRSTVRIAGPRLQKGRRHHLDPVAGFGVS
jgi:hypothetical protein